MLTSTLKFPHRSPDGYTYLEDEAIYQPDKHLALESPENIWLLKDFGYDQLVIDSCASPVAVTSPFRLLSDEGIEVLHQIAVRLKAHCKKIPGGRNPTHLAGGVYRSKFLRDLCACPVILEHMSKISETSLAVHSMPSQQLYINYAPEDITRAVDDWHYDGIGFDYVIMVSDPTKFIVFCESHEQ